MSQSRPHKVITNSFEITKLPTKKYRQYEVMEPDISNPRRRQEIVTRLQTYTAPNVFNPRCVYDGMAILYSSHDLVFPNGGGSCSWRVIMTDRQPAPGAQPPRGVIIKLTRVAGQIIDFSALDALTKGISNKQSPQTLAATNVLQFLIRQAPNLKYPHNARAYFTDVGKEKIGGGLELWRGYFQSVRPTIDRMLINVDISMSAMYVSEPLMDAAFDVLMLPPNQRNSRALSLRSNDQAFRRLNKFFKGVLIYAWRVPKCSDRKKTIHGLQERAGRFEFDLSNGTRTTVADYYWDMYQIRIANPDAFGVKIKNKNFTSVIPAELCKVVPNQRFRGKVPEALTSKVVSFATKKPAERLDAICRGASQNSLSPVLEYANSDFIRDSGMQISSQPIAVDGLLLKPPQLLYGRDQIVNPTNGGWNIMRQTFSAPAAIKAWAIVDYGLNLTHREGSARHFADCLVSSLRTLGLRVNDEYRYVSGGSRQAALNDDLVTAGKEALQLPSVVALGKDAPKAPTLIVVILPPTAADLRTAVKHFGDVRMGVPTQCIREDKIRNVKPGNQYCNNVALKINARLGGENSIPRSPLVQAEVQNSPYMVIGADVGHPGAGVQNQPSVASVVWSWDRNAVKYVAFSRVQTPREEIIHDLQAMVKEAVHQFGIRNKVAPAKIFFFRDGVSEGEYDKVAVTEIQAIRAAIDEVWAEKRLQDRKPKLTFIVVGKRHHIRFFPRQGEGDKSGNCPAGFVTNKGLNSPVAVDFYLQSHGGLLGTSRPSHYISLLDENFQNSRERLQEFAWVLCHSYARATRSVSIPAAVYYADIVCARGKFHFDPNMGYESEQLTASSTDESFNLQKWQEGYKPVNANIEKTMYFM